MDETEVAEAIRDGELTSPQQFANSWYFKLRITGTDFAFRAALDEYVFRRPEHYLTEHFLKRSNGLPVIILHPGEKWLNSKEYAERVIGSIVLPYLEGDEVWGIARILDQRAAQFMLSHDLSTSPAVYFGDPTVNETVDLTDGKHLLIEGKPTLLDHLAICEAGVWDKGGPPTGVEIGGPPAGIVAAGLDAGDLGALDMAEEKTKEETEREDAARRDAEEKAERERADAERRDAEANSKLDSILSGIDSLTRRMDAYDKEREDRAKRDAEEKEKEEKEREDAAKRDAESAETEHRQAAELKKLSEEEEEEGDKLEGKKDKKRKDSSKKDEDEEEEEREETAEPVAAKDKKRRHDAEEEEREKKEREDMAKKDAEIERIKADAEAYRKRMDAELASLKRKVEDRSDEDHAAFADAQARADDVYCAFGTQAPRPLLGEELTSYRIRMARDLQKHSPVWKDTDLRAIARDDKSAFGNIEGLIYADAMRAARDPSGIPAGQLREITRKIGPTEVVEFHGDPKTWMSAFMPVKAMASYFGPPPRRD